MLKLAHIIEYFTGPTILSTIVGIALLVLAFLGRDSNTSIWIPIGIVICGLLVIFAGFWAGVQKIGGTNTIRRAVATRVDHIIRLFESQFHDMTIAVGKFELHGTKSPSEEEVLSVFSSLKPLAHSPVVSVQTGRQLNWLEFMEQYVLRTLIIIKEIQQYMLYLDPKLVELLGRLSDCYHFKEVPGTVAMPPANPDLSYAAGPFSNYQSIIFELKKYFDKNLKILSSPSPPMATFPIIMPPK